MKLTPLDIRKQEFKKSMRGYDPEEVEAFLIMVADELEIVLRDKNQQSDELIKLRTQLRDYQQVEHTLRETLMKATSTVEESRFNSLREAELRIHEAELQAEKIIEQAKEELQELRSEINLLRAQKESFSRRLRHLLESQIELLDVLGMDDAIIKQAGEEEYGSSVTLRGRLPRPVIPAEEESHPAPHGAAPAQSPAPYSSNPARSPAPTPAAPAPEPFPPRAEEPRIIRGERRFDEPSGMLPQPIDEADDDARDSDDKGEKHDRNNLSDQIVN